MKVGVIGAAGYAGGELLRILLSHPEVKEVVATSRSQAGKALSEVHPGLVGLTDTTFAGHPPAELAHRADVLFLALEHGESSRVMGEILGRGPKLVVDLAADFRVPDLALYQQYYGVHSAPSFRDHFRYGLADVFGQQLRGAAAIAVPGCFATAAQLALHPLASIANISPALFAITGSSGSGVQPKPTTHHPVRANNVFAYSVLSHRHQAEIDTQWRQWTGDETAQARLMTHSGPFVRGIYLTLIARRNGVGSGGPATSLFTSAYADRPFVRLIGAPPELTHVVGTNNALIHVAEREETGEIQVSVVIDNLIKGAAGQAVQAMNLALGVEETAGLRAGGMFPC
jgi:N-acetyl-gamma-glutamyl-phosphate reductase common form